MAPRKKAAESAPVFSLDQYREAAHYVWREIERDDGDPLRVRLVDLSIRQTNEIPWGIQTPMKDAFAAVAPYVVEWSLEAVNLETGETVPVPPPAEVGPEVFELLPNIVAGNIVNWLKIPFFMKAEFEKKESTPSPSTTESPPEPS